LGTASAAIERSTGGGAGGAQPALHQASAESNAPARRAPGELAVNRKDRKNMTIARDIGAASAPDNWRGCRGSYLRRPPENALPPSWREKKESFSAPRKGGAD
jgi:hypothetical protein